MSDIERTIAASAPQAPDIFVSYSRLDRPFVAKLVKVLEQAGYAVWWDFALKPGEHFSPAIRQALDAAKCVVVVWSKASVSSDWVHDEAGVGRKKQALVPVRIQGVEPPLGFGQLHDVDFTTWQGETDVQAVRDLIDGIHNLVGKEPTLVVVPRVRRRMWPLWLAAAIALVALAAGTAYVLAPSGRDFVHYEGYGVLDPTSDIHRDVDLEGCETLCRRDAKCQAFSYSHKARSCFLTATYADMRQREDFRTGVRASSPQPRLESPR